MESRIAGAATKEPVRIAVFGGGYGAKVALPVFELLEEFQPIAVWSRRGERARELAGEAGAALGSDDLDEVLGCPGLEAVHVATPVALHEEVAIAAARRGLHVLCEKPLAGDLAGARRIAGAIETAGVVGAVNYGRRLQEARERVIERVREVVGRPRMVSVSLVHTDHAEPGSRPFTWVQDAEMGGGRLQGYGVHDLDLLLEAFGEVEAVAAATEIAVTERRTPEGEERPVTAEDAYALVLRFRGGGLGLVSLVSTAHHGRGDLIEVHGEAGTVRLDSERRLWWGRAGEELRCEGPLGADSKEAFARVARSFRAAIREGTAPETPLSEGLRVQALLDAVRAADGESRWVAPEPV